MASEPPDAIVVDLSRLPSRGRDLALFIRQRKSTRCIRLVFVDGDRQKVAAIRRFFPNAAFTTWPKIRSALKSALARPPAAPRKVQSVFAAYAGKPLSTKLGIKPKGILALIGAPDGFVGLLEPLPRHVAIRQSLNAECTLAVLFVGSNRDLSRHLKRLSACPPHCPMWIAWPKKTGALAADLTQPLVRAAGLASGFVDYKICSIDSVWSALLFRWRGCA